MDFTDKVCVLCGVRCVLGNYSPIRWHGRLERFAVCSECIELSYFDGYTERTRQHDQLVSLAMSPPYGEA